VAAHLVLLAGSSQAMLPVSATLSFGAAALVASLPANIGGAASRPPSTALRSAGRALAGDRAVRPLVAIGMLAAMAGALADFIFKQRLVSELPFQRIPPILVHARMGQAVMAIALQLASARWLLRKGGAVRGLVLLPAGLFLLSQGMSVGGELAVCLLARVLEGGLRRSLEPRGAPTERRRDRAGRALRRMLEPATQRLGQTAAMGVIITIAAVGLAPIWIMAALAVSSLGWLEWGLRNGADLGSDKKGFT